MISFNEKDFKKRIQTSFSQELGKNLQWKSVVKGYSKKYPVDKLCAIKELRMIGVDISEEYEKQLINSMEALKKQRILIFMVKKDLNKTKKKWGNLSDIKR
ncbi:hypothetical protein [Maribellus maritimus]|uniref:hypothetical protein n=1 Tax=Maribellus maritimus TaxID=2870838 RepID=UPI001EEACA7E|nr:hypothetical protein [Maribellus maritimus]MCG6191499.1 hypothetical protein [Maribellus maritimus]